MYFNRQKILSYNAYLHFIVLKRGYGKSYTFKDLAMEDFINKGEETIWIRRYKPEITATTSKFFDDIGTTKPEHSWTIKGGKGCMDNRPFIHFLPLSTAQRWKSTPFPNVKNIIFDEFIAEGATLYLPDECETFCSVLSTVLRDKKNAKVFLTGNKVKYVTPYNIYFNLCDFNTNKYFKDRRTLVYCNDGNNEIEKNYKESVLETILRGTTYYDYNFLNESLLTSNEFIEDRDSNIQTAFIININGIDLGVFLDQEKGRVYFDVKCDKTVKRKFVYRSEELQESYFLLSRNNTVIKLLKEAYSNGRVYFCCNRSKELATELLNYIV